MERDCKTFAVLSSFPLTSTHRLFFKEAQDEVVKSQEQGVLLSFDLLASNTKMTACEKFLNASIFDQEAGSSKKIVLLIYSRSSAASNYGELLFAVKQMAVKNEGEVKVTCSVDGRKWSSFETGAERLLSVGTPECKMRISNSSLSSEAEVTFVNDSSWKKSLVKTAVSFNKVHYVGVFLDDSQRNELHNLAKICKELLALISSQSILQGPKHSTAKRPELTQSSMLRSPITFQNKMLHLPIAQADTADFSTRLDHAASNKTEGQSRAFSETIRQISIQRDDSPQQQKLLSSKKKDSLPQTAGAIPGKRPSAPGVILEAYRNPFKTSARGKQAKTSKDTTPRSFIAISQDSDRFELKGGFVHRDSLEKSFHSSSHTPKKSSLTMINKTAPKVEPNMKSKINYNDYGKKKSNTGVNSLVRTPLEPLDHSENSSSMHREQLIAHQLSLATHQKPPSERAVQNIQFKKKVDSRQNTQELVADLMKAIDDSQAKQLSSGSPQKKPILINARPSSSSAWYPTNKHTAGTLPPSCNSSPCSTKLIQHLDSMKKMVVGFTEAKDPSDKDLRQIRLALKAREEVCKELQTRNQHLERENTKLKSELQQACTSSHRGSRRLSSDSRNLNLAREVSDSSQFVRISDVRNPKKSDFIFQSMHEKNDDPSPKVSFLPNETFNPFQKIAKRQNFVVFQPDYKPQYKEEAHIKRDGWTKTNKRTIALQETSARLGDSSGVKGNGTLLSSITFKGPPEHEHVYTQKPVWRPLSHLNSTASTPYSGYKTPCMNRIGSKDSLSRSLSSVIQKTDKVIAQYRKKQVPPRAGDPLRRRASSLGSHFKDMMLADLQDAARCLPPASESRYLLERMLCRTLKFHP
jgi:hypothetical protein